MALIRLSLMLCSHMVKVLLVLQVILTKYSKVENLLLCAPLCSETCLFFFDDFLSLWLQLSIMASPAWTSSDGMLSFPADLPSSVILLQLQLLPAGWGSCHCWLMEGHLASWDLLLLCVCVQFGVVLCPPI